MTNFAQDSSNIKKQEMALKDAFAKYSIKQVQLLMEIQQKQL